MSTGSRLQEIKLVDSVDKPPTVEERGPSKAEDELLTLPPIRPRTKVAPLPRKKSVATGSLKLNVSQAMVPYCRLLIYYVRTDGETVADSVKVDVEDRLENQVGRPHSNSNMNNISNNDINNYNAIIDKDNNINENNNDNDDYNSSYKNNRYISCPSFLLLSLSQFCLLCQFRLDVRALFSKKFCNSDRL